MQDEPELKYVLVRRRRCVAAAILAPATNVMTQSCLQGCGLGLDVSVSRRSRDVPTSRLGLVSRKIVNVSASSRAQPFTSRAQDQFSAKLCRPH